MRPSQVRARRRIVACITLAALFVYACDEMIAPVGNIEATSPSADAGTDAPNASGDAAVDATTVDAATDAPGADASPDGTANDAGPTCVGNPLTVDGTTPDGGAIVTVGITQLDDEKVARPGLTTWYADGPHFIDVDGGGPVGVLVFSSSDRAGNASQLLRVQGNGGARTSIRDVGNDGGSTGAGNAQRGTTLLTTLMKGSAIAQTEPNGTVGSTISTAGAADPSDIVVGSNGDIYFTDPETMSGGATTGVYRIASGGAMAPIATSTNGLRFSGVALGSGRLYVSVGSPSGAEIWFFDVNADGTITGAPSAPHGTLVGVGAVGGITATAQIPAGLALDVGGNVWIAEAPADPTVGGKIEVFSPTGEKYGELQLPLTRPTDVAFGGGKNDIVFVTGESGSAGLGAAGVFKYTSRCVGIR